MDRDGTIRNGRISTHSSHRGDVTDRDRHTDRDRLLVRQNFNESCQIPSSHRANLRNGNHHTSRIFVI